MSAQAISAWQVWAVFSAMFAALTAIFAKVGVENINPDLATFIRTLVILAAFTVLLAWNGQFASPGDISAKSWTFLVLSGLATGASWLCYFRALKLGPASLVAPIDKFSVVLVALFAFAFLGERPSGTGWLGIALVGSGSIILALRL
jgi:bacterial/archaeal transporter family protein